MINDKFFAPTFHGRSGHMYHTSDLTQFLSVFRTNTNMRISIKSAVVAVALCITVTALVTAHQSSPRAITPEDYYSLEFLIDPHISPDLKLVPYVVTHGESAPHRRECNF